MSQEIKNIIHELDPNLQEEDSAFSSAMILLAAAEVGPNADDIASLTNLSSEAVKERFARLEQNGVFKDGKIYCDWFDEETGTTAFWLDVCIAEGTINRV